MALLPFPFLIIGTLFLLLMWMLLLLIVIECLTGTVLST
jgi:hypothetical protein